MSEQAPLDLCNSASPVGHHDAPQMSALALGKWVQFVHPTDFRVDPQLLQYYTSLVTVYCVVVNAVDTAASRMDYS